MHRAKWRGIVEISEKLPNSNCQSKNLATHLETCELRVVLDQRKAKCDCNRLVLTSELSGVIFAVALKTLKVRLQANVVGNL